MQLWHSTKWLGIYLAFQYCRKHYWVLRWISFGALLWIFWKKAIYWDSIYIINKHNIAVYYKQKLSSVLQYSAAVAKNEWGFKITSTSSVTMNRHYWHITVRVKILQMSWKRKNLCVWITLKILRNSDRICISDWGKPGKNLWQPWLVTTGCFQIQTLRR